MSRIESIIESILLFSHRCITKWPTSLITYTMALLCVMYILWHLWIKFCQESRISKIYNKLPGLPSLTWIGYLLGNIELYYNYMWHIKRERAVTHLVGTFNSIESTRKDGIARFTIGFIRFVILFRAETVEEVISSMEHIEKSSEYSFFKHWLGLGLLTSTGSRWQRQRRLLTPAFHFKMLDSFFPVMNENAEILMQRFEKILTQKNQPHSGIDVRELLRECTLDTLCETAMGVQVGAQSDDANVEYVKPLGRMLTLLLYRILEPLYHLDIVYNILPAGRASWQNLSKIHTFIRQVIANRKEEMQKFIHDNKLDVSQLANEHLGMYTKKRYAFLDTMLVAHFQDPEGFTMKDIQDNVNTFMFEGHDTTSVCLTFTLLLIAEDSRVQDRIFEELASVFGGEIDRPITMEHTRQLKYLNMVIKESLRLYPPVPFIGRKINREFTANGYRVPVGCTAVIFIYMLHRDPKVFPQPERFLPERFESDSAVHKMPYAYMPLSAGPRNCIGQRFAMLEMTVIVASILRRYRLSAISKRSDIVVDFSVLIKTDTPVVIRFDKRLAENECN